VSSENLTDFFIFGFYSETVYLFSSAILSAGANQIVLEVIVNVFVLESTIFL